MSFKKKKEKILQKQDNQREQSTLSGSVQLQRN